MQPWMISDTPTECRFQRRCYTMFLELPFRGVREGFRNAKLWHPGRPKTGGGGGGITNSLPPLNIWINLLSYPNWATDRPAVSEKTTWAANVLERWLFKATHLTLYIYMYSGCWTHVDMILLWCLFLELWGFRSKTLPEVRCSRWKSLITLSTLLPLGVPVKRVWESQSNVFRTQQCPLLLKANRKSSQRSKVWPKKYWTGDWYS